MPKRPYISTGHAARLLGVTPDTVLKWIKRGKLVALRTAGGHYRVSREQIECLLEVRSQQPPPPERPGQACWEYYAVEGRVSAECRGCLVRKSRAARCFEIAQSQKPLGSGSCQRFEGECRVCPYYTEHLHGPIRLLVVTNSMDLRQRLLSQAPKSRFKIDFAAHVYDCSAQVERFRPGMVVLDCALPAEVVTGLRLHLLSDPRIPGVRVVLAVPKTSKIPESTPGVVGQVHHPIELSDLERFVESTEEAPETAREGAAAAGKTSE